MCPLALRDSGTVVDPHETSKLTRDPNAERTQECQRKQTTGHQMLRVCSPGLPALAGVLSVATLGSVRPKSAHMHSRRVLGSNGLHTGNVRETAVATAVSTMAARCSRGLAGPGTWAPELAKDALRCIPSRSSLLEALVVLGETYAVGCRGRTRGTPRKRCLDSAVSEMSQRDEGGHVGQASVLQRLGQVLCSASRPAECAKGRAPRSLMPQIQPLDTRGDGTQNARVPAQAEPKCGMLPGSPNSADAPTRG